MSKNEEIKKEQKTNKDISKEIDIAVCKKIIANIREELDDLITILEI